MSEDCYCDCQCCRDDNHLKCKTKCRKCSHPFIQDGICYDCDPKGMRLPEYVPLLSVEDIDEMIREGLMLGKPRWEIAERIHSAMKGGK